MQTKFLIKHKNNFGSSKAQENIKPFFQPKLTISQPNDPYEQQADAMAAQVMRMPASDLAPSFFSAKPSIQKKCSHCEQEEKLQMRSNNNNNGGTSAPSSVNDVMHSGGHSLDTGTKNFMESRFGYDFSNVKIHNDALAHQSSAEIHAKAYTHANHIAFASGQYQPHTNPGKELLAHELTHVVQQNHNAQPVVSRAVDDSSSCSPRVDRTAPPNPLMFIGLDDTMASSHLSFAIMMLKLDMMTQSGEPSGDAFDAYRARFGDPVASKGKFKNRFDGTSHDTLSAAQISEMKSLIVRLEAVQKQLERGIAYRCAGTSAMKLGNCAMERCNATTAMQACGGVPAIMICPSYWDMDAAERGEAIVHELLHITFNLGDHDTDPFAQTFSQRRREPQCYAGFIADVNKIRDIDPSCPRIIH